MAEMGYLLIGHAEVVTDMSSTTLDNPAMYDVWCCQRWWILAASASSPVGNLRQVRKKQTTDAVFLFLFGEPGHVEPRWIKHCWASFVNLKCGLTWAGISNFLLCKIISWCICAVYRWKTLVLPLSAGNHLRESLLSALAVWCQGDTSAAGVRHK